MTGIEPPEPERPLTPGEALARLFLDNADRGANHANDELVAALRQRIRELQSFGRSPRGMVRVSAEQSHRFAITGKDPEGNARTIILWEEADLVDGRVVRRVVLTLDATMTTATVLTRPEAIEVAQAMLAAAGGSTAAQQDGRRAHGHHRDRG